MNKLHHANIILGPGDHRHLVFGILEKDLNFNIHQNPDFLLLENESFGIDDARSLEKWAQGKPFTGEVKVSFLILGSITFEAQNALLKVLEEPPIGTYIFISLQNLGNILGTFLSRVRILDVAKNDKIENIDAQAFLHSKIKERLASARSLSKKEDKSKMKDLIKNLEEVAYKEKASANHMKNILRAKVFASARGSSPKMILEWLACVL